MLDILQHQRRHGASWPRIDNPPPDILQDEVCLWPTGAIPLLYETLVRAPLLPSGSPPVRIGLSEIYPYIAMIGHEFNQAYPGQDRLATVLAYQDVSEGAPPRIYVQFEPNDVPQDHELPMYALLDGFVKEGERTFGYPTVNEASTLPPDAIVARCRTFLLYDLAGASVRTPVTIHGFHGHMLSAFTETCTPISSLPFLLPEELPILIAFFHLSNVVRYAPLHLGDLFDSRASGMLHALRRHGTYRYLLLFWSFFTQRTYFVTP